MPLICPCASVFKGKKSFGLNKGFSLKTQLIFHCFEAFAVLHLKMTNLELSCFSWFCDEAENLSSFLSKRVKPEVRIGHVCMQCVCPPWLGDAVIATFWEILNHTERHVCDLGCHKRRRDTHSYTLTELKKEGDPQWNHVYKQTMIYDGLEFC